MVSNILEVILWTTFGILGIVFFRAERTRTGKIAYGVAVIVVIVFAISPVSDLFH